MTRYRLVARRDRDLWLFQVIDILVLRVNALADYHGIQ